MGQEKFGTHEIKHTTYHYHFHLCPSKRQKRVHETKDMQQRRVCCSLLPETTNFRATVCFQDNPDGPDWPVIVGDRPDGPAIVGDGPDGPVSKQVRTFWRCKSRFGSVKRQCLSVKRQFYGVERVVVPVSDK